MFNGEMTRSQKAQVSQSTLCIGSQAVGSCVLGSDSMSVGAFCIIASTESGIKDDNDSKKVKVEKRLSFFSKRKKIKKEEKVER